MPWLNCQTFHVLKILVSHWLKIAALHLEVVIIFISVIIMNNNDNFSLLYGYSMPSSALEDFQGL